METRPSHQFNPSASGPESDDSPEYDFSSIDFYDASSLFKAFNIGRHGVMKLPHLRSLVEIKREAKTASESIFRKYETLRSILERHEGTIQKRWCKRTRSQRLKILLKFWPSMSKNHRPDFEAFRKESAAVRFQGTKYRDSFMWPYINQEDLSGTKTFPLLLNSRGRYPPSNFAAADSMAMHLGLVTRALVPDLVIGHSLILHGFDENSREYGKLVSWHEDQRAFDWMKTGKQFIPGEGLLVLEAQERLLGFLINCSLDILHEIPESTVTSDAFPIVPEPRMKAESDIKGFTSLGLMAAEGPYRVPAKLDLSDVESLISARAAAAADHLWGLREDPDYFSRVVLEAKNHRRENVKDVTGASHPTLKPNQNGSLWPGVISTIATEAYLELEIFSELSNQVSDLVLLQKKYAREIIPSKDLPKEYQDSLIRFRHYVNRAVKGPLSQLKMAAAASPPLRKFFVQKPETPSDPCFSGTLTNSKPGVKFSDIECQMMWLLSTLWEDDDHLFLVGLTGVVDELERLIQSETQARDLLSPYVISIIGDLALLSQCLTQLDLYQPWAQGWKHEHANSEKDIEAEYARRTQPWAKIFSALDEENIALKAASLGDPTGGRFLYPIQKRRSKENVEVLRKAEANLDAFWAAIDQLMIAKAGNLEGTAVKEILSQQRTLQRTNEWVEPEKNSPPASVQTSFGPDMWNYYLPVSNVYSGTSGRSLDVAQPKQKIKTRGASYKAPASQTETDPLPVTKPVDEQPAFSVDARALKVFRAIFFNPDTTSTPGEISWNDFLHAMSSVGFSITKLYGSVWQFKPTNLNVERGIQFHEPHPRGKLTFYAARRFGRRLNRAYGWFGGMFIADKK